MLHAVVREVRYAGRSLARTPFASIAAVSCLAVAIGIATVVFSLLDGVVLKPLPFGNAGRVLAIWSTSPQRDAVKRGFSWPDIRDAAASSQTLEAATALANAPNRMTLTGRGEPLQIPAWVVSGSFFDVLGVRPAVGRVLSSGDDQAGSAAVVVISNALWQEQFGGDRAVIGSSITLDGQPVSVVGVTPPGFAFPARTAMWMTIAHATPEYLENRQVGWLEMLGLARVGGSPQSVGAELTPRIDKIAATFHPARGKEVVAIEPIEREVVGDTRVALWALFGAVLVVLGVACTNVGGLLLVRGAARSHEIAIRRALGAGAGHAVYQALTESAVVAVAGAMLAWPLAASLLEIVRAVAPADLPRLADVAVDWRAMAFAAGVTGLTAILAGAAPALFASLVPMQSLLRREGRGSTAGPRTLHHGLVIAEVALSVVLIAAAMLVGRTFLNLQRINVGYTADRVVAFDVPLPGSRYPTAENNWQFTDRFLTDLSTIPGVHSAAAVLLRPLWGRAGLDWSVTIEGQTSADASRNPLVNLEPISGGYFSTLGIPLIEGRAIEASDRASTQPVAVVGARFARLFWPTSSAVGRRLKMPLPGSPLSGQWFTVVGVVGDAAYRGIRDPRLDLYIPAVVSPYPVHQFVVRADVDPASLVPAIRRAVAARDHDLPIDDVTVLDAAVKNELAAPRFAAGVFVIFACVATLLAGFGLGTLVSWQVRQRRREIGIRLALGATSGRVVLQIVRDGAVVVGAGVVIGVCGAVAATRWLASLLYGVRPSDLLSLGAAAVIALLTGLLASYLAARRASRVDPARAVSAA